MEHAHDVCLPLDIPGAGHEDDVFLSRDQSLSIDRPDSLPHLIIHVLNVLPIVDWMDSPQKPKPPHDPWIPRDLVDMDWRM